MSELHSSEESYEKHRILSNISNKCKNCKEDLATHDEYCYRCFKLK